MLPAYWHRQHGPWFAILYLVAAVYFAAVITVREQILLWLFLFVGAAVLVLAAGMHHLTIVDGGESLMIQFGPVPLFRKRIPFDTIETAERGRTLLLDGWGIHYSLRGGWVWNIWGHDCIVLKLKKSTLRIGTNDAEQLLAFVRSKIKTTESK